MKVLHVISRLACHGAARQLALLQRHQMPSDFEARIVVLNGESAGAREWNGAEVQILEGVSRGEQVVVVGAVGLEDNAKVRIVKPGEKDEALAPPDKGGAAK